MNDAKSHFFEPVTNCWFLTGPTASGKTDVGLELAGLLDAEIISLDSMAVYRDMNVGTAKPTVEQRARVPHHLIDLVSPVDSYSLSEYLSAAHEVIAQIRERKKQVLFVGGSALYLKALLRGLYSGPPANWEFRQQIEEELQEAGLEALHERLRLVDPLSAAKLHPRDKRRIIRALEVFTLTGQPLSHAQTQFDEPRPESGCRVITLDWPRPVLHERIERRVSDMFEQGLVEEVRLLLDKYGQLGRTASQAVGYREVIAMVRGEADRDTTIHLVQKRTRQFARRQGTWFRSLAECHFWPCEPGESPGERAQRIVDHFARAGRR